VDSVKQIIKKLEQRFPRGDYYLVRLSRSDEMDAAFKRLLAVVDSNANHSANNKLKPGELSDIGWKLGWAPADVPGIFLNERVELEIADALAVKDGEIEALPGQVEIARQLLARLNLSALAQQNSYHLSKGEAKLVWFLCQWVKAPDYLFISDLITYLSPNRVEDILNFLTTHQDNLTNPGTVVIGAADAAQIESIQSLTKNICWKIEPEWSPL